MKGTFWKASLWQSRCPDSKLFCSEVIKLMYNLYQIGDPIELIAAHPAHPMRVSGPLSLLIQDLLLARATSGADVLVASLALVDALEFPGSAMGYKMLNAVWQISHASAWYPLFINLLIINLLQAAHESGQVSQHAAGENRRAGRHAHSPQG